MALIRLGSLVTRISGKVGGQTFGTSASGSYLKNTGTPRKSISLPQRAGMSLMGTTSQKWRNLTPEQRATFNAASPDYPYLNRVGETKFYSGYAIFGQLQNNTTLGFGTFLPIPLPKFSFTPITLEDSGSPLDDGFFTFTPRQAGVVYRLFMTRISSKGITNPYKNFFYIVDALPDASSAIFIPYQSQYYAKWGAPQTTGKFFYRVDAVHTTTGQVYKALITGEYLY